MSFKNNINLDKSKELRSKILIEVFYKYEHNLMFEEYEYITDLISEYAPFSFMHYELLVIKYCMREVIFGEKFSWKEDFSNELDGDKTYKEGVGQ